MSDVAGSSNASSDAGGPAAGASSQQEEKQEDEVVAGSTGGGASHSVRTKVPAPIFDQHGAEYVVPQPTIDAIESFVPPAGFKREGAREDFFKVVFISVRTKRTHQYFSTVWPYCTVLSV